MTSPEPLSAPGIHDLDPYTKASAPKTQAQMKGIGLAMRYRFLADVLYAVAGIEVFGISPFAALSQWADELVEMAAGALEGANYANSQLGGTIHSNVESGVQISVDLNGAESSTLTGFTKVSTGSGAGTYGTSGAGRAVWTKSGGLSRTHNYRHATATTGDYQAIQVLQGELSQAPIGLDAPPFIYITGRVNADQDTYVYARLGRTTLQVGCMVDGVESVFALVPIPGGNKAGQIWRLQCGTYSYDEELEIESASPQTFAVYRNSIEMWRGSGGASSYGEDYRGVGLIAEARSSTFATTQKAPGEIDVFSAADYTVA